eukprot:13149349-Alexandrium_andersonii.AAC.1
MSPATPSCMAGGLPKRTAEQVLEPLLVFMEATHQASMEMEGEGLLAERPTYYAKSWGYSSAFDR